MTIVGFADLKAGRSVLPLIREGTQEGLLRAAGPGDALPLAAWRDSSRRWFLTEFPRDAGSTSTWIQAIRATPDRVLLVIEVDNKPVGALGLRSVDRTGGQAEVDNVVRGQSTPRTPGLMSLAVRTLGSWAADELGARRLYLHVFGDNPARAFYSRLGFRVVGDPMGLSFEGTEGHGEWKPSLHRPERYLIRMEFALSSTLGFLQANGDSG